IFMDTTESRLLMLTATVLTTFMFASPLDSLTGFFGIAEMAPLKTLQIPLELAFWSTLHALYSPILTTTDDRT
ncbi:MAG: hypothetical protein WBQ89_15785, partial [Candidatus Acidiferrum sp.]